MSRVVVAGIVELPQVRDEALIKGKELSRVTAHWTADLNHPGRVVV